MENGGIVYQPQPLATLVPALMTAASGSNHVLATVEGYNNDGGDPRPGGNAADASGQQTTAIANHIITPLSKGVVIEGFTLNNGGPATIVSSTTFSLDTSGNMFVNGHSYRLHNESPVPTTINGEAVMPLPTGISVHSATLTPNAPALVISGTSDSLDSSSNLHFGGSNYVSSVKIAAVDPTQVNTIAGLPVIELAAGVSIAVTMPTTDASASQGLSGVPITLDPSNLVVGSVTIPVQNHPSSGSLPEMISGGSSTQGLGTMIATVGLGVSDFVYRIFA